MSIFLFNIPFIIFIVILCFKLIFEHYKKKSFIKNHLFDCMVPINSKLIDKTNFITIEFLGYFLMISVMVVCFIVFSIYFKFIGPILIVLLVTVYGVIIYFTSKNFINLKNNKYVIFEDTVINKEHYTISNLDGDRLPRYRLTFKNVKDTFNFDIQVDKYNYDYCEINKDYYVVLLYDTFYLFEKDKFMIEDKDKLIDIKDLDKYISKNSDRLMR